MQLIADVNRPVRICPRRGHDEHRVGEYDRAEGVRLVCCAYHGVLGGVSFDGESVLDENDGMRVAASLTLAGMVWSLPQNR